jgi:Fe-S-cluster-containing dehydrogenase component
MPSITRSAFIKIAIAAAAGLVAACKKTASAKFMGAKMQRDSALDMGSQRLNHSTSSIATILQHEGETCPVLVRCVNHKPIKLAQNDSHPQACGVPAHFQTVLASFFDEERIQNKNNGNYGNWESVQKRVQEFLQSKNRSGRETIIWLGSNYNPYMEQLLKEFKNKQSGVRIISHAPLNRQGQHEANLLCYKDSRIPDVDWSRLKYILCIDADPLGSDPDAGLLRKRYHELGAKPKILAVESGYTKTGENAHLRLAMRSDLRLDFIKVLLHKLVVEQGLGPFRRNASLVRFLADVNSKEFCAQSGIAEHQLQNWVKILSDNPGRVAVLGDPLGETVFHLLIQLLNEVLHYQIVRKGFLEQKATDPSSLGAMQSAIRSMRAGDVGLIIFAECNPMYELPLSLSFEQAVKRVPLSIGIAHKANATTQKCTHQLYCNHVLERQEVWDTGYLNAVQPVVHALGAPYSPLQLLSKLLQIDVQWLPVANAKGFEPKGDVEQDPFWPEFRVSALVSRVGEQRKAIVDQPVLKITAHPVVRGWDVDCDAGLKEVPDTATGSVWGPLAMAHPDTWLAINPGFTQGQTCVMRSSAATGGVRGQYKAMVYNNRFLPKGQVIVQQWPGENSLSLLSSADLLRGCMSTEKWECSASEDLVATVSTPVRQMFGKKASQLFTKVSTQTIRKTVMMAGTGSYWAMVIDVSKCNGCGACVHSCNMENNVPVVGPLAIKNERSMHWLRIEKLWNHYVPIMCQHCYDAPCEKVCPTAAAYSQGDGVSRMHYNRCIGARYCGVNCPYGVRAYNWESFSKIQYSSGLLANPMQKLAFNPSVPIRTRGMMEKCSFCSQRHQEGASKSACQEVCPTGAIVFGNIAHRKSGLWPLLNAKQPYLLLGDLNTHPSVFYLLPPAMQKENAGMNGGQHA